MTHSIPHLRSFWTVLVFSTSFFGLIGVLAQQTEVKPGSAVQVKLSEMPERFFQIQDDLGFFWQAFGNGALVSGETQYLQSGLNLIVDGVQFEPSEALVRDPAVGAERVDLECLEKRSDVLISRNLWFDTERAGVRVMDTLSNGSNVEKTLSVSLRTTYAFSWQSLHGSGGALLSGNPGLRLNPGDFSLGVHFNPAEGRHDCFFILGSAKGAQVPELKASPNSRELTFAYSVVLGPGESRSLVHWLVQRNLPDMSGDLAALSPFFQRGKLINPGVDASFFPRIVNFSQSSFESEPAATAQLKSLVALNGLMDRVGSHRRSEDILWLSPTNQVSGSVGREGALVVATSLAGDQEVKVADIAAIRGSAGSRRNSLIYLRDGRVLSGEVIKGQVSWVAAGAPESDPLPGEILDPNSLNLLLLATGPSDGVPPPKTSHFLQFSDGGVMALDGASFPGLRFHTPWGTRQLPLSEILEFAHILSPVPHYRLILKNGVSLTAFLAGGTVSLVSLSGDKVEFDRALVDRLWTAGASKLLAESFSETWFDFSELPTGVGPEEGFLLSGNSLVDGKFADEILYLSEGGKEVKVETAQIRNMRTTHESGDALLREIELLSGDGIAGELASSELRILSEGGEMTVSADQVFSYRRKVN